MVTGQHGIVGNPGLDAVMMAAVEPTRVHIAADRAALAE